MIDGRTLATQLSKLLENSRATVQHYAVRGSAFRLPIFRPADRAPGTFLHERTPLELFSKLDVTTGVRLRIASGLHGGNRCMATFAGKIAQDMGASAARQFERVIPSAAVQSSTERANSAMERYAQGDESAFASVYDAVAPRVHAYLIRQARDRAIADDLLQQTLLQINRKRGTYVAGLPVLPWAFAIARRLYIDECRRRKTDALWSARDVGEDDQRAWAQPDDEVATREAARLVEAELLRMPGNQRVAFELLKVDGLSHQEAAEALGTTVNAVKLRAFRAYTAIRTVLGCPLAPPAVGK
jgi:RNA polymerase sigma-70 factor (ECF subfamily)